MKLARLLADLPAGTGGGLGAELLRGGLGSGGMRVTEIVLGLASAILLARQLGAAGLGLYSVAIATVTLAALPIEFGFPALVMRESARAHATGDWNGVHAVTSFANRAILLISLVIGALAISFWPVLTALFPSGETHVFAVALAIPPLVALANVRAGALRGIRRPLLGTAPEGLIRPGCLMLMLTGAALAGDDWLTPDRAMALNVAAAGMSLGFGIVAFRRHSPRRQPDHESPPPLRDWLVAAAGLGAQRGLRVAQPQILLLIVGTLGSVDAAGLFRIAQRGATLASSGYATIVVLIAPYITALHAAGDRARLQRLITISTRLISAWSLLPVAVFIFFGEAILSLLFGPEFREAYLALVILSVGFLLIALLGPAQMIMTMLNHERVGVAAMTLSLGLTALACAVLVRSYGTAGAAGAEAAGMVLVEGVMWYLAGRMLGLRTSVFGR